jgi:hypothetical protein
MNKYLFEALNELDSWLDDNGIELELDIIGGFAMELHKINIGRVTTDIDNVRQITESEVRYKIDEIGRNLGLDCWIDTPHIAMPDNHKFEQNTLFNNFKRIKGNILTLRYLIITKIASYYDRLHLTDRDYIDVKKIIDSGEPLTADLLEEAIDFTAKSRSNLDRERLEEVKTAFHGLVSK